MNHSSNGSMKMMNHNHNSMNSMHNMMMMNDMNNPSDNDHQHMFMPATSSSASEMTMSLHGGIKEIIVFPGWITNDLATFIGSCLALIFISMFYEGLKLLKETIISSKISRKFKNNVKIQIEMDTKSINNGEAKIIDESTTILLDQSYLRKMFSLEHLIQTFIYLFQFAIGQFLMFSFMTYNYWICLCVMIGIATGYFTLGVNRSFSNDNNFICH